MAVNFLVDIQCPLDNSKSTCEIHVIYTIKLTLLDLDIHSFYYISVWVLETKMQQNEETAADNKENKDSNTFT